MKRVYRLFLTIILVLVGVDSALSSTADGILGAASTATFDISLTIPEQFKISKVEAIELDSWGGSGSMESNFDACVYHNGDASYQITISDNSTLNSGFALEDTSKQNDIAISILFNDELNPANNISVIEGTPTSPQSGANTLTQDCGGSGNMNIQVIIDESALSLAPPGSYQSQITVMINPD